MCKIYNITIVQPRQDISVKYVSILAAPKRLPAGRISWTQLLLKHDWIASSKSPDITVIMPSISVMSAD